MPVGTVTFVLGDVVGSTALWDSDPEVADAAIARLDALVAELVVAHGGVRPVEQGEGDSFVAAFALATNAVGFAVDLQRAVSSADWLGTITPALRIGVHSGDARLHDGLYRGDVLNRCSRIRDLAHGGQILVSGTTADLVIDGLTDGTSLLDLGLHRLRDLSRPERVEQLCHQDLPVEFPQLQSLDRVPHNLPLQLTSFVGRDHELREVAETLAGTRLVTLTGAGGSGKTRLALQLAAGLVDTYADGVWLVDLSAQGDANLVGRAVADALRVREMPLEDALSAVERFLMGRRVLLVVDNCEHLIDSVSAAVQRLISTCADTSVLATSREPLGLAGEATYRLPSLALPRDDDRQCASVQLFVERATAARPALRVDDDTITTIASICARLDGLPLAIELAAARCRVLSPRQIAEQLDTRFSLLSGGPRTAMARQRTLEASVDWSVDLLDDAERRLFRRLSVFTGSFSLEAVTSVGGRDDGEAWPIVESLTSLVDKSLVLAEEHADAVRYRLLETIRYCAAQQLFDADESVAARQAHAEYYESYALLVARDLLGPEAVRAYASLDRERDNISVAQAWLAQTGETARALALFAALHPLWTRSSGIEALDPVTDLLAIDGVDPATRARAMLAAAELAWLAGDLDRNLSLLNSAATIARTIADDTPSIFVDLFRGWRGLLVGDPSTEQSLASARDGFHAHELWYWSADALYGLGGAHVMRGDLAGGDAILREAVDDARRSLNPVALSRALVLHTSAVMQRGDLVIADQMLDEAAALRTTTADNTSGLFGDALRAWIAFARGQYEEADAIAARVADESRRAGIPVTLGWSTWVRISTSRACAAPARTLTLIADLDHAIVLPWVTAWCGAVRSEIALAEGDLALARATIDTALAATTEVQYAGYAQSRCLLTRSRLLHASGGDDAENDAYQALALAGTGDLRLETIEALELIASYAADTGDFEYAARLTGAARRARSETGAPSPPIVQPQIDLTLATLQAGLDPEQLDALLGQGHALHITAARAYTERGRGTRHRPSTGWQSLTPTESRVVELAATGIKNADIARQMFVSIATVKTHLTHIFTKLDVATRAELAAVVARRQ
jgi:predicted ATPase/class 3 adenylate cyclase/DNA-binding CsgD family transcriptional regulator